MGRVWTNEEDMYIKYERLLGTSVTSLSLALKRSEDEVWDRINTITEGSNAPYVTPDIDWSDVPPGYKYAWLVIDRHNYVFTWCLSQIAPKPTPLGYNGSCIRKWGGSDGVQVREGVDFRTIFRQRPQGEDNG